MTSSPPSPGGVAPGRAIALALLALWLVLFYPAVLNSVALPAGRGVWLVALVLGAVLGALPWPGRWLHRALLAPPRAVFVGVLAALSAGISWWMASRVLDGKVLALDSSVYLMQARALAHGSLGVPQPLPGWSARFLFEGPDGRLFGVFPPGYPLFVAPFVALGVPLLSGPLTAALMVVAQDALAGALDEDEATRRASLLLAVPSYARAMETADLLSHAFTALLATTALAASLRLARRPTPGAGLVLGAAAGWVLSARLLDGLVLGAVLAAVVVHAAIAHRHDPAQRRVLARSVAVAALGALPFVALVLVEQKVSTGQWLRPTQFEFFARSDYPPTCHRLGFGRDVGCSLEHPPERASFGPDGYGLDDALRVGRERAAVLGSDLLGFSPLLLAGLATLVAAPTSGALAAAAWWVGLGLAYLLFYYGNAPAYGARHLFPLAPVIYVLVARSLRYLPAPGSADGRLGRAHVAGSALLLLLSLGSLTQYQRWRRARWTLQTHQHERALIHERAAETRDALLLTDDQFGLIASLDPWRDRGLRQVALDDHAGNVELRRAHPGWSLLRIGPNGLETLPPEPPPAPGLEVRLGPAWPSRVWPDRLASRRVDMAGAFSLPLPGEGLGVHHAVVGGSLEIAFDVVSGGRMRLWLDGVAGPEMGRYDVSVDGHPLPTWDGRAPAHERREGARSEPIDLAAGEHRLRLTSLGSASGGSGLYIVLAALRGEPASPP